MKNYKIKNLKPKHKVAFTRNEVKFIKQLEKKREQELFCKDYMEYIMDREIFKEM